MRVRLFTPEEAKALLPSVRPLLAELRSVYHEYGFAREQWEELEATGSDPVDEGAWHAKADALGERVMALVGELREMGVEVKDPTLGLVDFQARRADGTTVYLCYRDDEPTIAHWHPLDTGFTGRRPLDEL